MIMIRDPEVVNVEPYILSEEFKEGLAKVGPNSRFWYRSKLDPLTDEEYRLLCERDEEEWNRVTSGGTRSPLVPGDLKLLRTKAEYWLNILKTTVEYRLKLLIFIS